VFCEKTLVSQLLKPIFRRFTFLLISLECSLNILSSHILISGPLQYPWMFFNLLDPVPFVRVIMQHVLQEIS
jgi:hypothetical protein